MFTKLDRRNGRASIKAGRTATSWQPCDAWASWQRVQGEGSSSAVLASSDVDKSGIGGCPSLPKP